MQCIARMNFLIRYTAFSSIGSLHIKFTRHLVDHYSGMHPDSAITLHNHDNVFPRVKRRVGLLHATLRNADKSITSVKNCEVWLVEYNHVMRKKCIFFYTSVTYCEVWLVENQSCAVQKLYYVQWLPSATGNKSNVYRCASPWSFPPLVDFLFEPLFVCLLKGLSTFLKYKNTMSTDLH